MVPILAALFAKVASNPHCALQLLEALAYGLLALIVCFRHAWAWIGYLMMMILLLASAALEAGLLVIWLG
jgi:hypothetical protein